MLKKLGITTVLFDYVFVFALVLCASCTNTKNATYFPGTKSGTIAANTPVPESVIQKNDILGISISSLNPESSQIFNTSAAAGAAGPAAAGQGYLVSSDGFIQFPILGNIKAEGLTKAQLKDKIVGSILEKKLLVDPIVSIRFLNFRVTVLGEVQRPSVVTIPNEKISLLEALGLAGDLTIYARRDNVMIIREEKDQRTGKEEKVIQRINLNSGELFTSSFYYLQSNDIVYVEPNKAKVASTKSSNQWLPILFSGLTLAVLVADQLIQ